VLTFDDGPHRRYSEEIAAILKQYDAPAVFFSVGRNLGTLDANGAARLNAGAAVSRKLMAPAMCWQSQLLACAAVQADRAPA
jgi:hypothetical protein